MERKNYLVEKMSIEDKNYLKSAIKKAFLRFLEYEKAMNKLEKYSIEDECIKSQLPVVVDQYFVDKKIVIINSWNNDRKYSLEQKKICVLRLDDIAVDLSVKKYLRTLTFNEKLTFFLLEIQNYSINKIAFLLGVTTRTIYNRYQSAKRKIEEEKNKDERCI